MDSDDPEEEAEDLKADPGNSMTPSFASPASASPQEPTMLEVHAPHEPIHTLRGFLINIAAIAVGLLLAIGLSQTVEALHQRHQRQEIEAQMRTVLTDNLDLDNQAFNQLKLFRGYLVELKDAIRARLAGSVKLPGPAVQDPRMANFIQIPSLAPYEAAQRNGTISLLSAERIRLYDRVAFARDLMMQVRSDWYAAQNELVAFQERFVDSPGVTYLGSVVSAPNLDALSPVELNEFLVHVSKVIKQTDILFARFDLLDLEVRALLAGARTENDLVNSAVRARPGGFGVDANAPRPSPPQP
jgi:hypothetical protein